MFAKEEGLLGTDCKLEVRDIRRQGSHSPEDVERSFHENCWAEVEKVNELEVRMQQAEHLEAE